MVFSLWSAEPANAKVVARQDAREKPGKFHILSWTHPQMDRRAKSIRKCLAVAKTGVPVTSDIVSHAVNIRLVFSTQGFY